MSKLPPRIQTYASLPGPPPLLPLWGKVLWYLAESVATGIAYKAFDYGIQMIGTGSGPDDPSADEWRRFRFEFNDTISLDSADTQMFTFDVVNFTNGVIDSSWTEADYDVCEDAFTAFATALLPHIAGRLRCERLVAYRMAFNPYGNVRPDGKPGNAFAESGAPVSIKTFATNATGGSPAPPQLCSTITERTALRANWGRCYLPTLGSSEYASSGRVLSTTVTALSVAAAVLVETLGNRDFQVVVPTTSVNNVPTRTLQSLVAVAVDDVADVQRRRRFHEPKLHVINPAPATAGTLPADEVSA